MPQPYPALTPPGQHQLSEIWMCSTASHPSFPLFLGATEPSQVASAERIPCLHPGSIFSPPSPALSCHHLDTPTYATANT